MFLGIDIHKREAQVAVRNDDGDVIEQVRVKTRTSKKLASDTLAAKPCWKPRRITSTSTICCLSIWTWLSGIRRN